ncbi:hypothetical protein [Fructobacillus tropaeoli]|uniref:hypothetical protein n=1 Tax=Fructobacillus tropaeoli TaxID=709323 RepID=UPI002D8AE032|nr:hypothetical protein LMG30238_FMBOGHMB_01598 [Fructobacillus tropaeoli]
MSSKQKKMIYASIGCLGLSLVVLVTAVQSNHQAALIRSTNKSHLHQLAKVQKQGQTIQANQQDGLPNSSEAKEIGEKFFQDMFRQLHDHQSFDQSKYATKEVCNAANIMPVGDRTKTYPIYFERQDIQYSTDLTGVSHGMGTIYYNDAGDNESYDILLSIENGQVTAITLGHIKDTTGAKKS